MILVTGGTGLVGGHLLYRFRESGQNIIAIYRDINHLDKTRAIFRSYHPDHASYVDTFTWLQADITDIPSLESIITGVTHIYHCAGKINGTMDNLMQVNVMGTQNMVNIALAYGIKKLCHVSSIAALGDPVGNRPINEDDFFNIDGSNTDYAITKYGAEMEVWRASQEGLDIIIVNPGVIIGEGNWNEGSGRLFSKIKSGLRYYTSGSSGFIDVRDVVQTMQFLMESAIVNSRFILVENQYTYKDILFQIAMRLTKKAPQVLLKKWQLYTLLILQALGSILGFKKTLSRGTITSLTSNRTYSNAAILEVTPYTFIPIKESIARTCENFNSHQVQS